jgi:tetratricopeptide (TPR) repeat protein
MNLPDQLRLEGNELFKAGNYAEAAAKYTEAMTHPDADCSILYSNRAQANLKLKRYVFLQLNTLSYVFRFEDARIDATKALELDPNSEKSLLRRILANEALGSFTEVRRDLRALLQRSPNNGTALELFKKNTPKATSKMNPKMCKAFIGHSLRAGAAKLGNKFAGKISGWLFRLSVSLFILSQYQSLFSFSQKSPVALLAST